MDKKMIIVPRRPYNQSRTLVLRVMEQMILDGRVLVCGWTQEQAKAALTEVRAEIERRNQPTTEEQ